jgi:hypothetical protein
MFCHPTVRCRGPHPAVPSIAAVANVDITEVRRAARAAPHLSINPIDAKRHHCCPGGRDCRAAVMRVDPGGQSTQRLSFKCRTGSRCAITVEKSTD